MGGQFFKTKKDPCKRTQQVTTMLSNNVGSCWHVSRGACKRTQHLPTLLAVFYKRSDAFWYYNHCNWRVQTFSRGQHCCGSMQTGATLLRYASPITEQQIYVRTCCAKSLNDRFQTIRNKCQQVPTSTDQHCCGSMQTDATCRAKQYCVLLANNVASISGAAGQGVLGGTAPPPLNI